MNQTRSNSEFLSVILIYHAIVYGPLTDFVLLVFFQALTEMYSMPNGEQEQDPEGEASGGESGEWHSDGEGNEESDDPSDEEEVESPPRRERRSKLTHDPASARDKATVQTGQSSKRPRTSSPAPTEKAPKQFKVVVPKTRKALPRIKIDIPIASA